MAATTQPIKRTALHRTSLALGATMTDFEGWQTAAQYRSPDEEQQHVRRGVGLADTSWLGKLEVRGSSLDEPTWEITGSNVWSLARGDRLVTCAPRDTPAIRQALLDRVDRASVDSAVSSPSCLHITDVTSVYAALLLAGPKSRDVLQRLTALDVSDPVLPDRSCARSGLAHVRATVLRLDIGQTLAYRLLVGWEYGAYVWSAVMHAGEACGIVPFGLDALHRLRDEAG